MKKINVLALMFTMILMAPIVVAQNSSDSKNADQQSANEELSDKERECLLKNTKTWFECFEGHSASSYTAESNISIKSIFDNFDGADAGVGLGTHSAVQSIRKKFINGQL